MESSRRHILQAEIEYWHEMLLVNRNLLPEQKESEMRYLLKEAIRQLNHLPVKVQKVAA